MPNKENKLTNPAEMLPDDWLPYMNISNKKIYFCISVESNSTNSNDAHNINRFLFCSRLDYLHAAMISLKYH